MIIQLRYKNYYQRANGVALIDIISVIDRMMIDV